ncbi:MAG: alpha-L-fucosidase [Saprospiraceae bacterium]|nr:alpha-L-fucosidase [Saprospiraceae bacterium]
MSIRLLVSISFLFISFLGYAQDPAKVPIPTQAQLNWQNAEMAAVFHYDLHVFDGKKYNQRKNRITPIEDYNIFNPKNLDTDQWVKAASDAGCKIAILTATHETGFALYQSDVNPYCLKAVNWRDGKGDVVKDFVKSCRKHDVLPGIYIGIRWNSFFGIHDFEVQGNNLFTENRQHFYNQMCEGMVEELMSRYGELAIVWFDGGAHGPEQGGPDVLSIFEKNQPNCLFYHNLQRADMRWGGSESGTVPYPCWGTFTHASWFDRRGDQDDFKPLKYGFPDGAFYCPAMSDAPLRGYNGRHEWFWEPGDEAHIYPLQNLMNMYYNSVGHNTSLIIGLTPDANGLLPEPDVKRLKAWGNEIERRFSNPIISISGNKNVITANLPARKIINHIVLMEDIRKGERVRKFLVEGKTDSGWQTVIEGTCIGHKLIHPFDNITASSVRLRILESKGEPEILKFAIYQVDLESEF